MSNEKTISEDVFYLLDIYNNKNFQNKIHLNIFNKDLVVDRQDNYPIDLTEHRPTIVIDSKNDFSHLTLIMIDPDAPSALQPSTGPFIHWILTNIDEEDQREICEYRSPAPRINTGTHRYIYLIYQSSKTIVGQFKFDQIEDRRRFKLKEFVENHQLELIWINFIVIHSQTST